jgi:hypothetical protein
MKLYHNKFHPDGSRKQRRTAISAMNRTAGCHGILAKEFLPRSPQKIATHFSIPARVENASAAGSDGVSRR